MAGAATMSKLKFANESLFPKDINKNLCPNLQRIMDCWVKFAAAMLDSVKCDRIWFDLEVQRRSNQIGHGIAYLQVELEI